MILPDKFRRFEDSIVSRIPDLLEQSLTCSNIAELRRKSLGLFPTAADFVAGVELLYLLGRLDVDLATGAIQHA